MSSRRKGNAVASNVHGWRFFECRSRTKRGASAGFVEIGRGDAELDEAMEGEEKDMDAQIRVRKYVDAVELIRLQLR